MENAVAWIIVTLLAWICAIRFFAAAIKEEEHRKESDD